MSKKKSKLVLEGDLWVDLFPSLENSESPCISIDFFIEDKDNPLISHEISLNKLLNKYIQSHTLKNKVISEDSKKDVLKFLGKLEKIIKKKKRKIQKMPKTKIKTL